MYTKLPSYIVGAVFTCERKPTNSHSDWAIVVKKPGPGQIVGHVPDELAQGLLALLTSRKILSMTCEVTGLRKEAEEGMWVQGGGIVIYIPRGRN